MKRFVWLLLLCPVLSWAIGDIDLSYVDKNAPTYGIFKGWVDSCLPNNSCYQFLPTDAAFMAKLDGGPQYCVKAIADADAYASHVEQSIAAGGQPNWTGNSQGMDGLSGDSYLAVGPRVRDLAIVQKWCPNVTTSQKQRWTAIITQAVYNVWHPTQATWGGRAYPWSGWTVTPPDPGDNYFYSFTQASQMYRWVTGDTQYESKTWPLLVAYFANSTGGSREGTGYGTSHKGLIEDVRWQRDLFGEDYLSTHVLNSIYYWVNVTTPDYAHFAAIGDQSRINPPAFTDYQRALVQQAMLTSGNAAAQAQGSYLLHHVTPPAMTSTYDYRDGLMPTGSGGSQPTALTYFGQSTGDLCSRTGWDTGALMACFRSGIYDQSHAHPDQGSFQLYFNGNWLAVDGNIFSPSGVEQDVILNNTLRFVKNGAVLRQGYSTNPMTVSGTDPNNGGVHATANLVAAGQFNGVAAVSAWTRKADFVGHTLTITDTYTPINGYAGVFQVTTPVRAVVSGKTAVAGALNISVLSPADAQLVAVTGTYGYRLDVTSATNNGYVVALSTDGTTPPPPPGNQPPIAAFTNSSGSLTVAFTDGSSDPDGTIVSRVWNFGDGSSSTAVSPSHTFAATGVYNVSLTVTDNGGTPTTLTKAVTVTVASSNQPPVADFRFDISNLRVDFYSQSTDADGTITGYSWDLGDGSAARTNANPSVIYALAGTYNVTLKVTDNGGLTSTKTKPVTVGTTAVCPAQPAPLTRTAQCPSGTTGTYPQTAAYSPAVPQVPPNQCWVLGPYLPTSPPAGSCPPAPVTYNVTFSQTSTHTTHRFNGVAVGEPLQVTAMATPVLHWHVQYIPAAGSPQVFDFPNASPLSTSQMAAGANPPVPN